MELLSNAAGTARFNLAMRAGELRSLIMLESFPGNDHDLGYNRMWMTLGSYFTIDLHEG
ncbi:hypothetical protein [Pseudoduganella buxea]|uniref:Uncharacterized protein n=1 Tax=Pseudoduganella buxea TaxID=1949069 RepID=A0A6I3SVI3_9BURK|nr:hypothetical protein [Pseudoduganella buxea]MTV53074.1 hypothetical protein [Pseudoduganella buxea]GGB84816.1 hypothetical protein GCM10011572_03420 [Pseudoduganella buxea]